MTEANADRRSPPERTIESLLADVTSVDMKTLLLLPAAAFVTALFLGGVIMVATGVDLPSVAISYRALLVGSLGSVYAISETLVSAAPLIIAGLSVAIGFRAGLFNIGAEGQMLTGGMAAVIVGFSFEGLPLVVHLPLALLAGALMGAVWGGIAGWLRATTGAHEVISTIMLNLIAFRLIDFLLKVDFIQKEGRTDPISKFVLDSAQLPKLLSWLDPQLRLNAGIFVALIVVLAIGWLLFRTTVGFEFRAVGANPDAARYAGIRIGFTFTASMAVAGALGGLAGGVQVLGVLERASPGFSSGIGFDAIAVALLGRAHPLGVLLAGLLFGALEAGGRQMQVDAHVGIDLITIIQALVVVFVAAPIMIKWLYPFAFRERGE